MDEGHKLKNPATKQVKCMKEIGARTRVIITGKGEGPAACTHMVGVCHAKQKKRCQVEGSNVSSISTTTITTLNMRVRLAGKISRALAALRGNWD